MKYTGGFYYIYNILLNSAVAKTIRSMRNQETCHIIYQDYHKVRVNKTGWYTCKDRQIVQMNRIEKESLKEDYYQT